MDAQRIGLGFDLRQDPFLQRENPLQVHQRLEVDLWSPVSADPSVWRTAGEIEDLSTAPTLSNPLHLFKCIDLMLDACRKNHVSLTGLWPVCITGYETNIPWLDRRYGRGYFEDPPREEELRIRGWKFMGFDVVDLDGLISGLKGCGYAEPTWSQLRTAFAPFLNEIGLFAEPSVASRFAEARGLEIRAHAPFAVVGVLAHSPMGRSRPAA